MSATQPQHDVVVKLSHLEVTHPLRLLCHRSMWTNRGWSAKPVPIYRSCQRSTPQNVNVCFLKGRNRFSRELKRSEGNSLSKSTGVFVPLITLVVNVVTICTKAGAQGCDPPATTKFQRQKKRYLVDSMRGVFGVGVAQLMVLSAMVPAYVNETE